MNLQNMSWKKDPSRTAGTRQDSLLSTVHEPKEHVPEKEPQGLQEEDQTLCCTRFMNLQNMSWSKNLKDSRNKPGLVVQGFYSYASWSKYLAVHFLEYEPQGLQEQDSTLRCSGFCPACPRVRTSRTAAKRPDHRTCPEVRTSRTVGTKLDSLLSTVHEPTEHALEKKNPQGQQEQDRTLCCPRFMNQQNMCWRNVSINYLFYA
jgi:hypothetical protein